MSADNDVVDCRTALRYAMSRLGLWASDSTGFYERKDQIATDRGGLLSLDRQLVPVVRTLILLNVRPGKSRQRRRETPCVAHALHRATQPVAFFIHVGSFRT